MQLRIARLFQRKRSPRATRKDLANTVKMQTDTEPTFLNRLPVAIRLQIYREVLPRGTVHFQEEKQYMFYVYCDKCVAHPTKSCDAVISAYSPLRYWGMAQDNISEFGWGDLYIPPGVVSRGEVALLNVCRQIHAEAPAV